MILNDAYIRFETMIRSIFQFIGLYDKPLPECSHSANMTNGLEQIHGHHRPEVSDENKQQSEPRPCSCVVSTAEAKQASTDNTKADLKRIYPLLLKEDKREDQVRVLSEQTRNSHDDTRRFLNLTKLREQQHITLMKRLLASPQFEGKTRPDLKDCPHDYTKDDLFFFVAASYFDGGVQTPEMKAFVDRELKRHHELEAHHPEHELYNDKQCSPADILEMAIDRLARNVQFGNGRVNMSVMQTFLPKFPKGDNEAKQQDFWAHVKNNKDFVQSTFLDMYPDAKNWAINVQ